MRYAFVREHLVEFLEEGAESLSQKYHEGILNHFVEIPAGQDVRVGDSYWDGVFAPPILPWQYTQLKEENVMLAQSVVALMDTLASKVKGVE